MNMRVNARLSIALPLVLAVLMSFSVGFAQDEGGDTSTEPAGVGEIAQAADNFNVSAVPTQEQTQAAVNAPKATANMFDEEAQLRADLGPQYHVMQWLKSLPQEPERDLVPMKRTPPGQTPSGDVLVRVTDDTGDVLTVFTDYSVVATHAKGEVFFQGYIAGESPETLMIVGKNTQGTQYALSHGDVIGLTTGGDVFFRIDNHWYLYDYDEDGNFVGLFDSDGNEYAVEATDDGGFTITDPAGDTGDFNADGSYDIQDPAGDVLDQGALFGENDGDPAPSLDAGEDPGSLDANSGDEPASTAAPDNSGDTSGGDNGDGS